jgi:uncharacterized repeat protein (TIGR02543 family)
MGNSGTRKAQNQDRRPKNKNFYKLSVIQITLFSGYPTYIYLCFRRSFLAFTCSIEEKRMAQSLARALVFGVISSCFLFVCTSPENPYVPGNITVTFEFPSGHSSGSWNIDSTVAFDAKIVLPELVDSAIISWGDSTYDTIILTSVQIASGRISIPPHRYTSLGTKTIIITTYADGETKPFPVEITISCTGSAIDSTQHSAVATEGTPFSISIYATGSGLAYQWYKNDTILTLQTHDSLKLDPVAKSDSGIYYCIVYSPCGADTSIPDTIKVVADITRLTVTYDGNGNSGGNVPADVNNYTTGSTVTVMGNTGTLVKTGYTFAGWNTASNGSGTAYSGGATFAMGSASITLYAAWTTIPTYSVTYDANGSTGGSVPTGVNNYTTGSTVTVLGNTGNLVKTGSTFTGWNTTANGSGTPYAGGTTFTI